MSLNERERAPPAKPISLEFPNYIPSQCGDRLTRRHMKSVCKALASVRKPLDISDWHVDQLNVRLDQDVNLAQLVPDGHFESRPFLYDDDLTAMLGELDNDNEDGYREVLRLPPLEGRKKPRLTYARNFFASLEDMSRYWDDSKDNYYEVEAKEPEPQAAQVSDEAQKPITDRPEDRQDLEMRDGDVDAQKSPQPEEVRAKEIGTAETGSPPAVIGIPTRPKMKSVYKGQRLGNGEQMTQATRIAAVRNLMKMVIHKFNCRDFEVNPKDRLRISSVIVPSVFYSFCVAKVPSEMKLARARMVEGPLFAVHSRGEVRFKSRDGLLNANSDFVGEKFDFFREMGCLLMVAKQRAREGKQASKEPAEHQWWAVKARWGGGETRWGQLANEVYEDEDPSWSPEEAQLQRLKREQDEQQKLADAAAAADLKNLKPDDLMANTSPSSERPKKKKRSGDGNSVGGKEKDKAEYKDGKRLMYSQPIRRKWYQEWTKIRPNTSTWDEKVIYRRIGMQGAEQGNHGWDDVYALSAANHHACILHMSVHEDYLEWMETGKSPPSKDVEKGQGNSSHEQRQSNFLYVSRSRWYDLFDVEQRKELLTGIWRIMCWMSRDEVPKEEFEKMEDSKRKQASDGGDHHMEI